jgi:hypothetical protein
MPPLLIPGIERLGLPSHLPWSAAEVAGRRSQVPQRIPLIPSKMLLFLPVILRSQCGLLRGILNGSFERGDIVLMKVGER